MPNISQITQVIVTIFLCTCTCLWSCVRACMCVCASMFLVQPVSPWIAEQLLSSSFVLFLEQLVSDMENEAEAAHAQ